MSAKDIKAIAAWHDDEKHWWNAYGEYMTYQWQLTPRLTKIMRSDLERNYKEFLLQPGGRLLDIGCGSGWLSAYFAEKGMSVTGIDVSREQVASAEAIKATYGLNNVDFHCVDFIDWDVEPLRGTFSRVFVSAFLHHLPEPELAITLKKISTILTPGGKAYFYEPLQHSGGRTIMAKIVDRIYNLAIAFLFDILPRGFGWWSERHTKELARGYTMNSPHEAPVAVELLHKYGGEDFDIIDIRGWHLNSIGLGMQSMGLRKDIQKFYEPLVAVNYYLDRLLLRLLGWEAFSLPGRFILCSIKMVRR